jgi:hypothetical protein
LALIDTKNLFVLGLVGMEEIFFLISPKSKKKLLNQMKGGSLENLKNIIPAKFS